MIYGLIFYDTITVSFGDRASCCLATPQCRNWRSFYTVRKWQSDDNKSTLCNFQYFWTSSWLFSLWRKDIVFDGLKIAVDEKVTQQVIAIIHAGCASVPLAFFRMEYTNMYNWRRNQRNAINRRKKYGEIYDVHLRFEFFFFVGSSKYIAEGIFRLLIGGSLFVFYGIGIEIQNHNEYHWRNEMFAHALSRTMLICCGCGMRDADVVINIYHAMFARSKCHIQLSQHIPWIQKNNYSSCIFICLDLRP